MKYLLIVCLVLSLIFGANIGYANRADFYYSGMLEWKCENTKAIKILGEPDGMYVEKDNPRQSMDTGGVKFIEQKWTKHLFYKTIGTPYTYLHLVFEGYSFEGRDYLDNPPKIDEQPSNAWFNLESQNIEEVFRFKN
uniref:Uncharacterized protein n=1 Tax=viral metagenome TaxID=1070528 RepID=A0A6M3J4X0_9ZZZZ